MQKMIRKSARLYLQEGQAKSWGEQERGVIGPELTHEQRMALLEFLKTQ
jgi:hypothetical protein